VEADRVAFIALDADLKTRSLCGGLGREPTLVRLCLGAISTR
jgi:hypothetical protein